MKILGFKHFLIIDLWELEPWYPHSFEQFILALCNERDPEEALDHKSENETSSSICYFCYKEKSLISLVSVCLFI